MVLEWDNDETINTNIDGTKIEENLIVATRICTVVDARFTAAMENHLFFLVSLLQGESVSEEPNWVISLESTSPTLVTLPIPDLNPYNKVLPMNLVPWITYNRRNLIKKVTSSTAQLASIQDSESSRDQDMGEKNSVSEIKVMSEMVVDEANEPK
ncbi:uncharacterized protein E6C27_scaffold908G001020 [Cucumis melo var. makuwa]|uniref:Uncharacterized protein n=2 Tax=Cucumis melo TaxID=3656 RepID=A0A5A7TV20_CUCMM|nr:uncharacterized protein E6C27_scaffold908G001020 [Cucumis melo var. makuwa]